MKRSAAGVRLNRYRSRSTPYRVSTSCSSCLRPPANWRSRSRTDPARSVGGLRFTLDLPTSRAAPFGCDGLEIRPHHVRDAADGRISPQFVHGAPLGTPAVAERFQRDVGADLAPILEAVGHRLSRVVDVHLHAVDVVLFDSLEASLSRETHDPERELALGGRARLAVDRESHLGGILRGQLVEAQSGEEADDAVRNSGADRGEHLVLAERRAGGDVEPPSPALELPSCS